MTDDTVHRAFRIAYDGSDYHGFQRQPAVPTVEDAILAAFDELGVHALEAGYAAAGRTDAGVSAAAQTIALAVPPWLDPNALNGALPADIRAWAAADTDPDFHPRRDAIERTYVYHLHRAGIDLDRVRAAADRLVGVHDFRDLSAASEDTTRELGRLDVEPDGDILRVTAAAPSFVHQQVRRIVQLLAEIGRDDRSPAVIECVLDPAHRVTGGEGIPPAPPGPLVLSAVEYDAVAFDAPSTAPAAPFRNRAIALRSRASALSTVADRIRRDPDRHQ